MQEILTQTWLLAELTADEVSWLYQVATLEECPAGKVLIEAGRRNDSLWIVCQGSVEIRAPGAQGPPKKVAELFTGDIFGEMSWLDGHPASASTVAQAHTQVLRIRFADFEKFLGKHPDAHIQILRKFAINLSHRLRGR